jgi:hypothetical protein
MKHLNKAALLAFLASLGMSANAALDAAVTTAVTSAQTDLIALYGALTTAGVAIWVVRIISRKFGIK